MLKKILFSILILLVVLFAVLYFARNMLAETAVEEGSAYALGVETNLGSAKVELGGGSFEMNDYQVNNPEGYESKYFFVLKRGMLDVDAGSVLDDEVKVDSLILEGATISLEVIDGKANFKELLNNLNKLDMSESESKQKFLIKDLAVRDITVAAAMTLMGKKQLDKTFTVDNLALKNVGGDSGATIAEITATVVKTLIKRATSSGQGLLPEGFNVNVNQLKQDVQNKVEDEATNQLKDIGGKLLKKDGN